MEKSIPNYTIFYKISKEIKEKSIIITQNFQKSYENAKIEKQKKNACFINSA